ncbi:hypothetical protein MASR1M60_26650 [Rhodocyclaceae bacterium]
MNAPQLPREAAALEAIGHLKQKICLMWGSPELDIFISRLIMDSRDGTRQGLPMAVGAELLFLAQTNKIIRAITLMTHQNVTLKEAYKIVDEGDQKRLEADAFDNPLVSRDTIIRENKEDRRSGIERRHAGKAEGAAASFGQMMFKLVFSKAFIFLIVFAMTVKLLWPYVK